MRIAGDIRGDYMIKRGLLAVTFASVAFLAASCCCCGGILNALISDDDETDTQYQVITDAPTEYDTEDDFTTSVNETTETDDSDASDDTAAYTHLDTSDAKTVTVMVYMNGTDLEEDDAGCATSDLKEMLSATIGDNVNLVVETLGTTDWVMSGISGSTAQRWNIRDGKLTLVEDNLGRVDVTEAASLTDFITFAKNTYPADRYMLILWNHGGGPVYGYGVNDWDSGSDDSLMLDEIQTAVADSGVYFDAIGFDACLMGSLEVAYALQDSCEYLIASEDFESGDGWEYANWLTDLNADPSIDMKELGKTIVDDYVVESDNAEDKGILAVIQTAYINELWNAWLTYAYENKDTLVETNMSFELDSTSRALPKLLRTDWWEDWDSDNDYDSDDYDVTMDEYAIVDLLAVASVVDCDSAETLKTAVESTIIYAAATTDDKSLTGISVSLPYGDVYTYSTMESIYSNIGLDATYLAFLEAFAENGSSSSSYDWGDWGGMDDYDWDDYYDNGYDDDYWDDYWSDYTYDEDAFDSLLNDLESWLTDYDWYEDSYDDYDSWGDDDYWGNDDFWDEW